MAKNAITDWDVTAGNNSDISGINLAEGCPAAGINDAIRTVMSQIATWLAGATGPILKVAGLMSNTQQIADGNGTGRLVGFRNIPLNTTTRTTASTLALTDAGLGIATSANVAVPLNSAVAFPVRDTTIIIYNDSTSAITITQTSGVTLRLAGSNTTGNRILARNGLATLNKMGTDEWVCSGAGVS